MDYRKIIQDSLDYIEEHLKAPITGGELSQRAHYSLFHYYRLFQSVVGMPVMQYILRRRLLHAIYEISRGGKRIDVVLQYGFETYAGFYKAFRREFCCTPSVFLREGRAKPPCKLNLWEGKNMDLSRGKLSEVLWHWGLEKQPVEDIVFPGSGVKCGSAVYVGDGYVLKFSDNPSKVKNAVSLYRALEGTPVLSPSLVRTVGGRDYVEDGGWYFTVTRRIQGRQMTSQEFYERDGEEKAKRLGEMIGQLHQALSQVEAVTDDVDLYQAVRDWALPESRKILDLPAPFCRDYLESFGRLYSRLPRQVIHRDPNPANILVSQGKWGFVDFELAERNLRIYDPCYAATAILSESFEKNSPEKRRQWLEIYGHIVLGYHRAVHLTEEERRALPYVVMANQLICTAWFSRQEKYREIFEVNRQMTRWLLSVFNGLVLHTLE